MLMTRVIPGFKYFRMKLVKNILCGTLKEEFQWRKITLDYAERSSFTSTGWKCIPQSVFTASRCFFALYCTAWSVGSVMKSSHLSFVCIYGVIGQFLTTVYFIVSAALTEIACFKPFMAFSGIREEIKAEEALRERKRDMEQACVNERLAKSMDTITEEDVPAEYLNISLDYINARESVVKERRKKKLRRTKWYHKLQWFLFYIATNMMWIALFLGLICQPKASLARSIWQNAFHLHTFVIFPVILLIDVVLNSIRVQMIHQVYPAIINIGLMIIGVLVLALGKLTVVLLPGFVCKKVHCIGIIVSACLPGCFLCHVLLFMVYKIKEIAHTKQKRITFHEDETFSVPSYIYSNLSFEDNMLRLNSVTRNEEITDTVDNVV